MPKINILFLEMYVGSITIYVRMRRKEWNGRNNYPEVEKQIDIIFLIIHGNEHTRFICKAAIYQNIHIFKLWFLRSC
jgi:hypothetical protein